MWPNQRPVAIPLQNFPRGDLRAQGVTVAPSWGRRRAAAFRPEKAEGLTNDPACEY